MASFTLHPCRVREYRFIRDSEASPTTVDWRGLVALLAPTRSSQALRLLTSLQVGAYVGLVRSGSVLTNFLLINPDRGGDIRQLLKYNPDWASRVERVYNVTDMALDSAVVDLS